MSGRVEIPKTRGLSFSGTLRMLSGTPFTIQDDTVDTDMNRINFAPLPAGTYNPFPGPPGHFMNDVESEGGRNGARGPGFVQLDLRAGYKVRLPAQPDTRRVCRRVQRHQSRELQQSRRAGTAGCRPTSCG